MYLIDANIFLEVELGQEKNVSLRDTWTRPPEA